MIAAAAGAIAVGSITDRELSLALAPYTSSIWYLGNCRRKGEARIGLHSETAGHVTAGDAAHAAAMLFKRARPIVITPKNKSTGAPFNAPVLQNRKGQMQCLILRTFRQGRLARKRNKSRAIGIPTPRTAPDANAVGDGHVTAGWVIIRDQNHFAFDADGFHHRDVPLAHRCRERGAEVLGLHTRQRLLGMRCAAQVARYGNPAPTLSRSGCPCRPKAGTEPK